jgi:hypothetical protein
MSVHAATGSRGEPNGRSRGRPPRVTGRGRSGLAAICAVAILWGSAVVAAPSAGAGPGSFIGGLTTRTTIASTVPANGDVNPYGVAIVGRSQGRLTRGSVLVSNFNDKSNAQGTGTTIVEVSPSGHVSLFARIDAAHLPGACPGGVGLTTALAVLQSGWVVVGSLPTSDGSAATAKAGCLLVLDATGRVVETWAGGMINGPWDMAAIDRGDHAVLFVSNVLNGTVAANGGVVHGGTVIRITVDLDHGRLPRPRSTVVIGSGFAERTDPDALVVGPTGLTVGENGTVYVADTVNSRLAAIPDGTDRFFPALHGASTVSSGGLLNSPLGLAMAPNGHLLSVNGGDGLLVETTPGGTQVASRMLDSSGSPPGAGALFGLAVTNGDHGGEGDHAHGDHGDHAHGHDGLWFVDDADNTLNLQH